MLKNSIDEFNYQNILDNLSDYFQKKRSNSMKKFGG